MLILATSLYSYRRRAQAFSFDQAFIVQKLGDIIQVGDSWYREDTNGVRDGEIFKGFYGSSNGADNFLDAGLILNNDSRVVWYGTFKGVVGTDRAIFGQAGTGGRFYITDRSGTWSCGFGNNIGVATEYPIDNFRHKFEMYGGNLYIDDTLIYSASGEITTPSANFNIFGLASSNIPTSWDIETFEIYQNGTDLTAKYNFEEQVRDISGNGNDGVLSGDLSNFYIEDSTIPSDRNKYGYNFFPTELLSNGNFEEGTTDWDTGGWIIDNNKLSSQAVGAAIYLTQTIPVVVGKTYKVIVDVASNTLNGANQIAMSSSSFGGSSQYFPIVSSGETMMEVTATSTNDFRMLLSSSSSTGEIVINSIQVLDEENSYIPADLNNLDNDVNGDSLENKGQVKLNDEIINTNVIQGNGDDNYINTGIIPDNTTVIEVVAKNISGASTWGTNDNYSGASRRCYPFGADANGNLRFGLMEQLVVTDISAREFHTIKMDLSERIVYVDGVATVEFTTTEDISEITLPLYILAGSAFTIPVSGAGNGVCLSFKIWKNGVLAFDLGNKAGAGNTVYNLVTDEAVEVVGDVSNLWTTSDIASPGNLLDGFSLVDGAYIPASKLNIGKDVLGNDLTNPPAINGHNGSENLLIKPSVAELINVANKFTVAPNWFTGYGYDEIVPNYEDAYLWLVNTVDEAPIKFNDTIYASNDWTAEEKEKLNETFKIQS